MNTRHTNTSDDAAHLQALLKDHNCPCPHCAYNLRGLTSDTCPECGKPIDVSSLLNRENRLDVPWLIMVMSFAAALPWSLFYVWQRLIIRGKIHYGDDWNPVLNDYGRGLLDRSWPEALRMFASTAWWLSVPLVFVVLLACRRRISRWPRSMRWGLACLCVLMLVLSYRRWQWWWHALGFNGSRYPDWPWWYIN